MAMRSLLRGGGVRAAVLRGQPGVVQRVIASRTRDLHVARPVASSLWKRWFGTPEEKAAAKAEDAQKRQKLVQEMRDQFSDLKEFRDKRGKRAETGPGIIPTQAGSKDEAGRGEARRGDNRCLKESHCGACGPIADGRGASESQQCMYLISGLTSKAKATLPASEHGKAQQREELRSQQRQVRAGLDARGEMVDKHGKDRQRGAFFGTYKEAVLDNGQWRLGVGHIKLGTHFRHGSGDGSNNYLNASRGTGELLRVTRNKIQWIYYIFLT
ncbi:uncharacterized protein MONBRDRAFT_35719 [Monosiga brevicollis MX1]|uniref:Uncharacterized protein n=1 Tax=Monosiga brevicollis TaxID=81824 RepID=A9UQZ0_MONBE|nr:uncharacterized protein MONBRDRAFT_35719 [Monosiga brevicollis MX1]EDQ93128.1 predicted protein [Monosiga brevicollis MX1]|eukprot:XP_001742890.1 hypothetical protein [Monosiga brevicollis MX1]